MKLRWILLHRGDETLVAHLDAFEDEVQPKEGLAAARRSEHDCRCTLPESVGNHLVEYLDTGFVALVHKLV